MPDKVYRTAIYCRLSREDGDKVESNSIASQRAICEDYIARHEDLELVCEPFVDDGYSGVSFNRPQFKKLEEAIRKGALDCIVVKDLSRFSRNYIDGGRYIEKIFPQLGIRFIAINDAYDSLTGDPQSDSFVIPFKNLINDSYCKDISMKIRSSLEVKQKSGEFVGSFAPYGYMKSPENKNQLIVDEAVSEYVQMIFSMYKDGFSIGRIAKRLNQMGVLSPMEYKHSAGVKFDTVFKTGDTAKWTYKAVQRILTNEVYIGVLAQGKRGTPNYKVRVVKSKDESEWVKVENAHEALVSYEDFMAVKVMMQRDMRCSPDQDEAHLFSGFLFCGDCQQPMIRKTVPSKTKKYIYYVCSTNKHSRTCSPHSIAAKEVEEKVFRAIHDQIELVINLEHALAMIERLPSQSRKAFNYEAQIAKIEEEIERYQKLKLGLYENFIGGVIDKSEYFEFRNSYTKTIENNILKNLVYTGTLVSRKMKSCGVGSKKRVVNEPIIVEGTHEAIISKEDFELAQKVIRGGGRNPTRKQHDYPLKGLVRCGNCKRAMTRRKNKTGIRYFQCIHSVNNGNTDCPVGRSFPEMDIEKVVFHALTQFLASAQKEAVQNREVGDLRKSAIKECADKIRILQKQNEQHKASKLRLYEKYAAGSITKEAYIQQKTATDTKIAENDEAIQRSHERMKELDSETSCSDEKLDAVCDQYADCKALTYELTHAFISAVYIYDLDNIEIVWKFKDFLTTSEGEAK